MPDLQLLIEDYTSTPKQVIIFFFNECKVDIYEIVCFSFSRCTRFRFGPLKSAQILPRLEHVAEAENVSLTDDGKKALISLSGGDMRKVSGSHFYSSSNLKSEILAGGTMNHGP